MTDGSNKTGHRCDPAGRSTDRIEALAPLLLLLLHGLTYNEVGELAAGRGLDYGPVIETALDAHIPFVPVFIMAYSAFWPYPLLVFAYLYRKLGWRPAPYRRLFAALAVLIVACCILWVVFPVQVGLRVSNEALAKSGLLGGLVQWTYWAATPWNACPSFHVAGAWFLARAVRMHVPERTRLVPLFAVLIIVSTVLIRIHYLLDIVFGLAVSELAFRFVLVRLEDRGAFEHTAPNRARAWMFGALLAGALGGAILLGF